MIPKMSPPMNCLFLEMKRKDIILLFAVFIYIYQECGVQADHSFVIDFDKGTFLKDGEPFHYVAGSFHYMRVPHEYWEDRLTKMYAAGLDAVQTYVAWNAHEPTLGKYDFDGQQDLEGFIKLAQKVGLLVILRVGPYICGEWEYGGFPAWILKNNGSVVVRTMDPGYIQPVDHWLSVLLPKIKPLLYHNGGPIIMAQVENEYGSYFACDHAYTSHLRDTFKLYLGDKVILFTTDGDGENFLKCGAIDDVFATVDFGPSGNVSAAFEPMRKRYPNGPFVNSEFYTGWLDHWGNPHQTKPTETVLKSLKQFLDMKANVNMYMFEGGTNFAYWNGADPGFTICPTSYDYDAPLTEAGDPTEKYMAIRDLIGQYKKLPPIPVPPATPKYAYGKVNMRLMQDMSDIMRMLRTRSPHATAKYPLTMENIGQNFGFIVYYHMVKKTRPVSVLSCDGVRDRAHVFLDLNRQGLLDRHGATQINMLAHKGQSLFLFVENQGHVNFGSEILNQSKGLISNVTFGGEILTDWEMYTFDLDEIIPALSCRPIDSTLRFRPKQQADSPGDDLTMNPAIFQGNFTIPSDFGKPKDTFLLMPNWFKGQAFVNKFNLGRYWPYVGPQVTLYVPATALKIGVNTLTMFELDYAPCTVTPPGQTNKGSCHVELVDTPFINGTLID